MEPELQYSHFNLILIRIQQACSYDPHFIDKETEVLRMWKSHGANAKEELIQT